MPPTPTLDPAKNFILVYRALTERYPRDVPEWIAVQAIEVMTGRRSLDRLLDEPKPPVDAEKLRKKPEDDGDAFQFFVAIDRTYPRVSRMIELPMTATFWDLHVAIQDALGWNDTHLHQFSLQGPLDGVAIGIPQLSGNAASLSGWECYLAPYFAEAGELAYVYDFGDEWRISITFADRVKRKGRYPRCFEGENAAPPEDCGGADGYDRLKKALAGKKNAAYREARQWLAFIGNETFDPLVFDPASVVFTTASFRLKRLQKAIATGKYGPSAF